MTDNARGDQHSEARTDDKRKRLNFPKLTDDDHRELRSRQQGRCALTGDPLESDPELHHVVPAKHGGVRNGETNAFVKDFRRNGVLINRQSHIPAHGGNFNNGPAMPHSSFSYSHGSNRKAHKEWAAENGRFADEKIWKDKNHSQQNSRPQESKQQTKRSGQGTSKGSATPSKVEAQAQQQGKTPKPERAATSRKTSSMSSAFGKGQNDQSTKSSRTTKLTKENTRNYKATLQKTDMKKTIK